MSLVPIRLEIKPNLNTTSSPTPLLSCFQLHFCFTSSPSSGESRVGVAQELGLWSVHHRLSLQLLPPQGKEDSHSNPATSPSVTAVSAELFLSYTHSSLSSCSCSRAELLPFKCVVSEALPRGLMGSVLDRSRFS